MDAVTQRIAINRLGADLGSRLDLGVQQGGGAQQGGDAQQDRDAQQEVTHAIKTVLDPAIG